MSSAIGKFGTLGLALCLPCLAVGQGRVATNLNVFDRNGDGVISTAETSTTPNLREAWNLLDTNRDGQIDSAEFLAFEIAKPRLVLRGNPVDM